MAVVTKTLCLFFFFFLSICLSSTLSESESFYKTISPKSIGINLNQHKLTHFHFYFHDRIFGQNITAVNVAQAPNTFNYTSLFGLVTMMDDPLTTQPDIKSTLVGRAQGMYASSSLTETSFLMMLNFVFSHGKYNGSTLSLFGRNAVDSGVREMPIVGGSGLFRFARGYAQAKTYDFKYGSGVAVIEYNVFVIY